MSPKAIPQLADAGEVIKGVDRNNDVTFTALVPNLRGAIRALECQIDEIVVFLSASESHNQKNLNRSIHESLTGFEEIVKLANDNNIPVHGDISTAFGCPFEGNVQYKKLVEWAYAGLFFDFPLALTVHLVEASGEAVAALLAIILLMSSYFLKDQVRT